MLKQAALGFLLLVALPLQGCGGGGGGSSSSFAGTWTGALYLVRDDCGLAEDGRIDVIHRVQQDQNNVVVDVVGGGSFRGTTIDNGKAFAVTDASNFGQCSSASVIRYDRVKSGLSEVLIRFGFVCRGYSGECVVDYIGETERA